MREPKVCQRCNSVIIPKSRHSLVRCKTCGEFGLKRGVRDEWGFGVPCEVCNGSGSFWLCGVCVSIEKQAGYA